MQKALYLTLVITALSLFAPVAAQAFEQTVTLRADQYLEEDVIRVKHVFDGAGAYGEHALAPTPPAGESLDLGKSDLLRIVRAFQLVWEPEESAPSRISLRRRAVALDADEISALLEEEITGQVHYDAYRLALDESGLILRGIELRDLSLESLDIDPLTHDISADFTAIIDDLSRRFEVTGKLTPLVRLPVVSEKILHDTVISAREIDFLEIPEAQVRSNYIIDPQQIIGMTPRRTLKAGVPIRAVDLVPLAVVQRNGLVTLALNNGAIRLTAKGRSLDEAALGDLVTVMNLASKRMLEGVVTAPGVVTVTSNASNTLLGEK